MPIIESYLITTKNLNAIMEAVVNAQAPTKFTLGFLEQLGFKSKNDRLYIRLFKDLNILDGSGAPTSKYYELIDQTQTATVLGECIRQGYADLFQINKNAQNMTKEEVKNKLKTIFQGKKKDHVLNLMANTYIELCKMAVFETKSAISRVEPSFVEQEEEKQTNPEPEKIGEIINKSITTEMHYNIQIHLPETKEMAVYDAIFKSLKEHLL
ncbi:hypothetical protein EMN47_19205 [Prolixibacteraceae bacterium JC049]|nr:hypothetical protein [Prolixibacteraceae bacterium JC049]